MDKWLEYWQQEDLQPDVFTDKTGKKHKALQDFWQQHISSLSKQSSILDIASGAGAIYRCVPEIHLYDAHALDISNAALERLKKDIPSAHTYAQRLTKKSFKHQKFDAIVSQFGIEYLGKTGFAQLSRLLKDEAKFAFLSHIKDGAIDNVTQRSLKGLALIKRTEFLTLAENVAEAFRQDKTEHVKDCVELFMKIEPSVMRYTEKVPEGHHTHLYHGVKHLLSNYNNYAHDTVVKWIETARKQAAENTQRLRSMHRAALDQQNIDELSETLLQQGLKITSAKPFYLKASEPPVAWEIVGVKKN